MKKYKDKQRKEYAKEFYCRVEWNSTWEFLEGGTPAKSECVEPPKGGVTFAQNNYSFLVCGADD